MPSTPSPRTSLHRFEGLPADNSHLQKPAQGPLISVVIPTLNRPLLVERAVKSALSQSFVDLEVVVVIDGPDPRTEEALSRIDDERLHVLSLHRNVGGSEARNVGIRYSRSKWIALLDDDDEWLPQKLSKQWTTGEAVSGNRVIVGSRFLERTESAERSLPIRLPPLGEPFSNYLFVRLGWNSGEGFIQTSTWLISRQLLIEVPFTKGLKRCQDLDWLLRATAVPDAQIVVVPEVLAVFHHDDCGPRVSRSADWKFLYDWAAANRKYFTPAAFSFFIATFCAPSAAQQREGLAIFLFLLRQCISTSFSWKCIALFLICWWLPEGSRRNLRSLVERLRVRLRRIQAAAAQWPSPRRAASQ